MMHPPGIGAAWGRNPKDDQLASPAVPLAQAYRDVLDALRTERMPLESLARYFNVAKKTVALILRTIEWVERIGRLLWRVPLSKMPPAYHAERGWLRTNDWVLPRPRPRARKPRARPKKTASLPPSLPSQENPGKTGEKLALKGGGPVFASRTRHAFFAENG